MAADSTAVAVFHFMYTTALQPNQKGFVDCTNHSLHKLFSLQNGNKEYIKKLAHVVYCLYTLFDPHRVLEFRHLD